MSASAFTPTVLTISSGTGSGSGEKNYITNPSMASATTGWNVVGDFTLTRTTAASELPREYTTATGIKIVATSGTQSTADYIYFDFNLDDVDLGRKLKIQWSQKKIGTYSAGQLAVVITSQADRTTALITPQTTAIPASDLDFVTSFDSTTTAALSLVIRATADMTTGDGIVISDVIVGPGEIVQGAAVGEFETVTSYTIVGATTNPTPGSGATYYRSTFREGNYARIRYEYNQTNAGSAGSGSYYLPLPSGLNIDFARIAVAGTAAATNGYIGSGTLNATNNYDINAYALPSIGSNRIGVAIQDTATSISGWGSSLGPLSTATIRLSLEVLIPIAEWVSSGTINLGPAAQIEYASNSTAWGTSNTTAFQYGSSGAAITGALSSEFQQRIQFQYPIQDDDILRLEFRNSSSDPWFPQEAYFQTVANSIAPYTGIIASSGADTHGATFYRVSGSNTQLDVVFGRYVDRQYSGTVMQTKAWANGMYWRVRKAKASSPVGFGLVNANDSGLTRAYSTLTKIRLNTGNGFGSTNTTIRRFSTTVVNTGTGITYADSSTLGATFTVTEAGIYSISYSDGFNAAAAFGVSLNSTQLTTSIATITAADRLCLSVTSAADYHQTVGVTLTLSVGDVIRAHASAAESANPARSQFTIQRIA